MDSCGTGSVLRVFIWTHRRSGRLRTAGRQYNKLLYLLFQLAWESAQTSSPQEVAQTSSPQATPPPVVSSRARLRAETDCPSARVCETPAARIPQTPFGSPPATETRWWSPPWAAAAPPGRIATSAWSRLNYACLPCLRAVHVCHACASWLHVVPACVSTCCVFSSFSFL